MRHLVLKFGAIPDRSGDSRAVEAGCIVSGAKDALLHTASVSFSVWDSAPSEGDAAVG